MRFKFFGPRVFFRVRITFFLSDSIPGIFRVTRAREPRKYPAGYFPGSNQGSEKSPGIFRDQKAFFQYYESRVFSGLPGPWYPAGVRRQPCLKCELVEKQ